MRTAALVTLVAAALTPLTAAAGEWRTDPAHSAAHFEVDHLMVSTVRGSFSAVEGTLKLDEADLSKSEVTAKIDVSSIDTGVDKRDAHLRSPDFLDAGKHPHMTFTSTQVKPKGENRLEVTGALTLRGVTRPVVLQVVATPPVKNPFTGETTRGFRATGEIDRKDFGLTWNKALETGGVLVGDAVRIVIDAEFLPVRGEQAAK